MARSAAAAAAAPRNRKLAKVKQQVIAKLPTGEMLERMHQKLHRDIVEFLLYLGPAAQPQVGAMVQMKGTTLILKDQDETFQLRLQLGAMMIKDTETKIDDTQLDQLDALKKQLDAKAREGQAEKKAWQLTKVAEKGWTTIRESALRQIALTKLQEETDGKDTCKDINYKAFRKHVEDLFEEESEEMNEVKNSLLDIVKDGKINAAKVKELLTGNEFKSFVEEWNTFLRHVESCVCKPPALLVQCALAMAAGKEEEAEEGEEESEQEGTKNEGDEETYDGTGGGDSQSRKDSWNASVFKPGASVTTNGHSKKQQVLASPASAKKAAAAAAAAAGAGKGKKGKTKQGAKVDDDDDDGEGDDEREPDEEEEEEEEEDEQQHNGYTLTGRDAQNLNKVVNIFVEKNKTVADPIIAARNLKTPSAPRRRVGAKGGDNAIKAKQRQRPRRKRKQDDKEDKEEEQVDADDEEANVTTAEEDNGDGAIGDKEKLKGKKRKKSSRGGGDDDDGGGGGGGGIAQGVKKRSKGKGDDGNDDDGGGDDDDGDYTPHNVKGKGKGKARAEVNDEEHDNWDDDEEDEVAGGGGKAATATVKGRQLPIFSTQKNYKQRLGSSPGTTTASKFRRIVAGAGDAAAGGPEKRRAIANEENDNDTSSIDSWSSRLSGSGSAKRSYRFKSPLKVRPGRSQGQMQKRIRWSSQEEDDLRRGVQKHGVGKWADIHKDTEYDFHLRNQVDLKDKWTNLKKKGLDQSPSSDKDDDDDDDGAGGSSSTGHGGGSSGQAAAGGSATGSGAAFGGGSAAGGLSSAATGGGGGGAAITSPTVL